MTEALIDSLSPLTPQPMESDDSQIIKDPSILSRNETPPMQVFTEGITPLRERFEGKLLIEEAKHIVLLNP